MNQFIPSPGDIKGILTFFARRQWPLMCTSGLLVKWKYSLKLVVLEFLPLINRGDRNNSGGKVR